MSTTVAINRPKTEREPSNSPVAEVADGGASLQPTGAGREQRLAGGVITVSGAEPFESGVLAHLRSLGGAGIVAAGFALAILIAGSAVALPLRLGVEAMIRIVPLFR